MSYILDALTKAAKQRGPHAPALERMLAPAPAPSSAWARARRGLIAALALGAGLLVVLMVTWLRPVPIASPPDAIHGAGRPAPSSAAPTDGPELRPTVEVPRDTTPRGEREAMLDRAPAPAKPKRKSPEPSQRQGPQAAAPTPAQAPAAAPARAPAPTPAAAPARAPDQAAPEKAAAPVPPPPTSPMPQKPTGLRLEALIYSDLPATRMIFINGHKYVEGDVIDGRLRVEEIKEDGVTLSEQGRRFTLRPER